ncbi:MAG: ELM1/GtrOC1 family putative glycosyltransferase [Pseudomonadota bacterium]
MSKNPDIPVWIVSVRKTGHINQCLALADALGLHPDRTILIDGKAAADRPGRKQLLRVLTPWQVFRALLRHRPPRPLVILSSGRSAIAPCRIWRHRLRRDLFAIHVAQPRISTAFADILIASRHQTAEGPADAGRVLSVDGVLARRAEIASKPASGRHPVFLVGGKNTTYDYDGPAFRDALDVMARTFADTTFRVVFSRRTFPRTEALIRDKLSGAGTRFVAVTDRDGFTRAIAEASHFVVCPDSITMVSECCTTGRPVHAPAMDHLRADTENARFIDHFVADGYVAPLAVFDWTTRTRHLSDQAVAVARDVATDMAAWRASLRHSRPV